jgi:hypothetical protein
VSDTQSATTSTVRRSTGTCDSALLLAWWLTLGGQRCVLKLAAKLVVTRNVGEVLLEAKAIKHVGV